MLGRRPPEKRGPLSGPRVEDLRCGAGVTRSELAAELGISRPTLAAHESGDRLLLAETTDRIPAALRAILRKRHEHTKELAGELLAVLRKHPEGISRKAWERELDQGSYGVPAAIAYLESSEAAYPFRTSRGTFYASEPWPERHSCRARHRSRGERSKPARGG